MFEVEGKIKSTCLQLFKDEKRLEIQLAIVSVHAAPFNPMECTFDLFQS